MAAAADSANASQLERLRRELLRIRLMRHDVPRANKAIRAAATVEQKFAVFKTLPLEVQHLLWIEEQIDFGHPESVAEKRSDRFSRMLDKEPQLRLRIEECPGLHKDWEFDAYESKRKRPRYALGDLEHDVDDRVVLAAAVEFLARASKEGAAAYPAARDVDAWLEFLKDARAV